MKTSGVVPERSSLSEGWDALLTVTSTAVPATVIDPLQVGRRMTDSLLQSRLFVTTGAGSQVVSPA